MDQAETTPALPVRAKINWAICLALMCSIFAVSIWGLTLTGTSAGEAGALDGFATLPALAFHVFVACGATALLVTTWLDPVPMDVKYTVMGEPQYKAVEHRFVHSGQWTTFTVWCNTLCTAFFWCAAACSAFAMHTGRLPETLLPVLKTLWEVTLPMSFFVNIVVTFVLIPGFKKEGRFDIVWIILTWRVQLMHNGYVLVSAMEAVLVGPPIALGDFPIIVIYGLTYLAFAHALYAATGIYHYFFFDPRFKFAPCAMVGLLALLTALYCGCSAAVTAAAQEWTYRAVILVAALATCSFRDASAIAPSDASQDLLGKA